MAPARRVAIVVIALALGLAVPALGQLPEVPDTVVVPSGALTLRALLWRPRGAGPFPAVLFNHGSGNTVERQLAQAEAIGPVFARHGYVLLFVFRRGSGLSLDQGTSAIALMNQALAAHGQEARNRMQLRLLEGEHLNDAFAALGVLRRLPEVDGRRVAVAGHSFGASLSLLMAERDSGFRAAVLFSGSAQSWDHSPDLRGRLLAAVARTTMPVFFIQAANDYSLAPARALSAEMARLGKRQQVRIYPQSGGTADEGHEFIYREVPTWEADVFSFLDENLR